MTATERVEAVNAARHTLIQAATGLVVIGGVIFTAQGLWYTAQSLDASRQGQITDRYTKAVEQIGSGKLDVRLGGQYALERLAQDSPRDHQTVYDVLAAFVREHDPKPDIKRKDLPKTPATDVQAALTLIGRRNPQLDSHGPDLRSIRTPYANLFGANLFGANLAEANLTGADLTGADLTGATLAEANLNGADLNSANLSRTDLTDASLFGANPFGANLTDANLFGANLSYTDLTDANLTHTNLTTANLTGADLTRTNLTRTDLNSATLTRTDLTGANLFYANLTDAALYETDLTRADLRGANLTGIRGITVQEIRKVAIVDDKTRF